MFLHCRHPCHLSALDLSLVLLGPNPLLVVMGLPQTSAVCAPKVTDVCDEDQRTIALVAWFWEELVVLLQHVELQECSVAHDKGEDREDGNSSQMSSMQLPPVCV